MLSITKKGQININNYATSYPIDFSGECSDSPVKINYSCKITQHIQLMKLFHEYEMLIKNYQILCIEDKYILKNSKNTALIDQGVYQLLEPFKPNKMPKELLETLYQLEFLVDANH